MTWTLALDTALDVRVGLAGPGGVLTRAETDTRSHVERLTPLVGELFDEAGIGAGDLTTVVVGMGPGPFTGLRVGIVTAETIAFVARAALRRVCTLDVLALAEGPGEVTVATDARRGELYWARYRDGRRVDGPHVSAEAPGDVRRPAALDPALMATRHHELPDPGPEPLYLRPPDAVAPTSRKSALPRRPGSAAVARVELRRPR